VIMPNNKVSINEAPTRDQKPIYSILSVCITFLF